MFLQPTVIPNVKMEECVFALENADVLLDLEEDIVTKVNEFMGARQFEYIKCINTRVCHDELFSAFGVFSCSIHLYSLYYYSARILHTVFSCCSRTASFVCLSS